MPADREDERHREICESRDSNGWGGTRGYAVANRAAETLERVVHPQTASMDRYTL